MTWAADVVANPIGSLATQGIMGVVAVLAIVGCRWVIGQLRAAHDRELKSAHEERDRAIVDRDAALGRLDTQTKFVQEQVIPLFVRATELTRAQLEQMGRHV